MQQFTAMSHKCTGNFTHTYKRTNLTAKHQFFIVVGSDSMISSKLQLV